MAPVLGIDLGTTNSVVCVADGAEVRVLPDPDGNLLIPSVVSFHPQGDVLVGHAARERRLLDARNTVYSIKRLIGRPFRSPEVQRAQERFPFELCEGPTQGVLVRARGETYTLPEISAFVLREVRRIAEDRLNEQCTQAVITVPANFNELQRSATKAAGRVAGLEVLRILNEPTAAALAYGYGKGSRERIAVFDLGGGTFDITILELAGDVFEVLSTAGDTFLGGDDIDVLVAEKMADAFLQHHRFDPRQDAQAYERLRAAAEWAKCQLSEETEVQLRVEELAYGEGGASLDLTFGLKRSALEKLARPLIGRAFDVCEDAMRVASIRPTQLDNVILVGGSTRIPLVRAMVTEYFGREPLATIDPDLVVARGAALQAAALAPQQVEKSGQARLARVALKRMSMADLQASQDRRAEIRAENEQQRPNQPAFQPPKPAVPMWDEMDELPTRIASQQQRDEATQVGTDPLDSASTAAAAASFDDGLAQPTAAAAEGYDARARAAATAPDERVLGGASISVAPGQVPVGQVALRRSGEPPAPPTPPAGPVPVGQVELRRGGPPAPPPTPAGPVPVGQVELRKGGAPPPLPPMPPAGPVPVGQVELRKGAPPPPPPPSGPVPVGQVELKKPGRRAPPAQGGSTLGFGSGGLPVPDYPSGPPDPPPPDPTPDWMPAAETEAEPAWMPAAPADPPEEWAPPQEAEPEWMPPPQAPAFEAPPPGLPPAGQPTMRMQEAAPVAPAAAVRPPLLLDVTPLTLGIETVGGYCEGVIERNAAIPVEQTRVFSTGQDDQQSVSVRIVQGESRRLDENQPLGQLELTGLRQAARGDVRIEVTFLMDADGTLGVRAVDVETGRQQSVRINLVGGVADDEILRMQERQARMMGS